MQFNFEYLLHASNLIISMHRFTPLLFFKIKFEYPKFFKNKVLLFRHWKIIVILYLWLIPALKESRQIKEHCWKNIFVEWKFKGNSYNVFGLCKSNYYRHLRKKLESILLYWEQDKIVVNLTWNVLLDFLAKVQLRQLS